MEVTVPNELSQFVVEISDATHAGAARRAALRSAELISMEESDCGALAIAVTELATNVVKHAGVGRIVCEPIARNGTKGLRVLCIDKGPGIADIARALEDGYSTFGTSGNGLGAVRRLATHFDVYSLPNRGTCVLAEFWPKKRVPVPPALPLHLGVISVPIRGESVCGDGWATKLTVNNVCLMVVDGLGHGMFAAEAAREAERVLMQTNSGSPAAILQDCHDALRKTRGAAAAIAAIDKEKKTLSFAGLGNISATLLSQKGRRGIASHNGTVGHYMHKVQEFTLPWDQDSVLIMHSDGLTSKWDLEPYPGLSSKDASIIAAVLYRDFDRERDDVTVLVAKNIH
jgi:anti-sigma regulatory factor (Ser/Thr protein kinase)